MIYIDKDYYLNQQIPPLPTQLSSKVLLLAQRIQGGRRRQREARRLCSQVSWWRRKARWPRPRVGKWAVHGKVETLDSKAG